MLEISHLSGLGVEIGIEVGSVNMSLQEVLDLNTGQVIELAVSRKNLVRLRIGAEQIGTARFVKCGESVALEVLEILEKTD